MNGKKKLRKRITAFLMTLVMAMTLVMSVEPMRVRAASYSPGNPKPCRRYPYERYDQEEYVGFGFIKTTDDEISIETTGYGPGEDIYIYIDNSRVGSVEGTMAQDVDCTRGNTYYCYFSETYTGPGNRERDGHLYFKTVSNYTITRQRYDGSTSTLTLYKYVNESGNTQYVNGSNGTSIPNPSARTGYTFNYWSKNSFGGIAVSSTTNLTSATTIYENWTPNTYYVQFDKNLPSDASSSSTQMANQQFTYDDFTQNLSLNTYEVPGYDFLGWSTSQDATTPDFTDGALMNRNLTSTNNATVNLYAVWEKQGMKITYDSNAAGTTGSMGMQKIILNTPTALNTNQFVNPGNQGMAFNSWNTEPDGSGTAYTNRQNVEFSTPGEMTIYAQWDEAGVKVEKNSYVNYYKDISQAFSEESGNLSGMTITLLKDDTSNPGTIPANVTVDLAGLTWTPGGDVTNNGTIVGTGTIAGTATVTNNGTIENVTLDVPKVTQGTTLGIGGTLDGGTVSASTKVILGTVKGTIENNGDIIGPVVSGASITHNKPKFIVQFSDNGNAFTNADASEVYKYQVITSGEKVTAPTEPKADGVLFVKWGKDSSGSAEWNYTNDTVTENTIIYAIWETHAHGWTYDVADDTVYAWCNGNARCPYHGTSKADAPLTLKIAASNKTYSGSAYNSDASNPDITITNTITAATNEAAGAVTYYKAGADGTKTGDAISAPVDAGNYVAEISIAGKTAAATFTISQKTITADMISLDHADKKYTVTGGTITPSVTVKDGEVILENGETKDYVLSGETSHAQYGTHSITVTGKGNYTGSSTVAWNITDPYAPSGAIAIVSKTWNSFPAGTDFGYFFKETQRVTLSATDGREESGVDKVYYCKSLTPCTTTEQLAAVTWTEIANGGSFYINPNANVYIYAKIADKAGNVTYLASDGMVLYTDSARATESITYTKTSTADVTADVVLNGNTISKITLDDTTLVKGQDYTISENGATIAFKASFLQTLAARDAAYTLTVSYNPGGKIFVEATGNVRPLDTTIDLTVKKAQGSLRDISDISKEYDGSEVAEPSFITTNDKGTGNANVTFAYKVKDAADSTYTAEKPVNAGTYVVKVMVAADDNYEAVSGTAEFTIRKAEITAAGEDYESVYDGAAHGITVDVTGMTDAYTVSYGVMPEEADAQITYGETPVTYEDTGTYTVYYKVSSANYNDSFGSAKVKISPKTIGISWSDTTFVYDGEEHMPTAVATGLVGDDACSITVTGGQKHVGATYTATATAVSNPNYQLPEDVTTEFAIVPAELTVTAEDAAKHIGKNDPEYTYKITAGALVEGDSLSGISLSRTAGETAGEYAITAAEQSGSNPDYHITFVPGTLTIEDHVAAVDAAVAPTCTETGFAEGSHCSVCDAVLVPQETVPALGHDWSGEWKVTREATATEDGRREITCKRDGCGHKKYDTIPAIGTEEPEDPNAGDIEKYADVSADSPIPEAALGNKKEELLEAPGIFTPEEKEAIRAGADAKVWLEVTKTDEASIPADAKAKMTDVAKQIMGDNLEVVYFDAGLYKQINGGSVTELHEPGIGIRVTVRLPEQLLNHDKSISREYKILRLHNGDVTVLGAVFHEATGELTFETDKFSTYAIAYSDKKLVTEVEEPSKEDTVTTTDSPATGDAAEPLYWMMIMLLSLGAVVFVRRKKEDKQ